MMTTQGWYTFVPVRVDYGSEGQMYSAPEQVSQLLKIFIEHKKSVKCISLTVLSEKELI